MERRTAGIEAGEMHGRAMIAVTRFDGIKRGYRRGIPDLCMGEVDDDAPGSMP